MSRVLSVGGCDAPVLSVCCSSDDSNGALGVLVLTFAKLGVVTFDSAPDTACLGVMSLTSLRYGSGTVLRLFVVLASMTVLGSIVAPLLCVVRICCARAGTTGGLDGVAGCPCIGGRGSTNACEGFGVMRDAVGTLPRDGCGGRSGRTRGSDGSAGIEGGRGGSGSGGGNTTGDDSSSSLDDSFGRVSLASFVVFCSWLSSVCVCCPTCARRDD